MTPKAILFAIFLPCFLWGEDDGLFFVPDSGIRVDSAGISKVVLDTAGLYYIYYTQGANQGLAVSGDGLNFGQVNLQDYPDYHYQVMPDGSYRRYFVEMENDTAKLRSRSSDDGIEFTLDPGHRFVFPSNDAVTTPNVYTTYFNNALGEVHMVYLAGEIDNARSIHTEPGDDGWSFGSYTTDIFGDSILGGGNHSYWDPHAIVLNDGRIRIFTMNQHGHPVPPVEPKGTIYSFTSADYGLTFTQDPEYRLRFDDYGEFEVLSLNDPKVIVLPDGRYRMYVATMIRTGPEENDIKWAITSATTSATIDVMIHSSERPAGFRLEQNYPNPFNLQTRIGYSLPEKSRVLLTIHDIMGRDVVTLVDELQEPGIKTVSWTGVRKDGRGVSAGLYFFKIQAGNFKKMRKLLLLK